MNKKKTILGILLVLVVLASALYLKKESTYSMVQDQRKSENSQGKTQDGSDDRSPQDIAADKKIAKQRAKNRKDWLEKGMTGSVTRGGDIVLGPRGDERGPELFAELDQSVSNYIKSKPDTYPPREEGHENDNDAELVFGPTVDYRIDEMIGTIPAEARKGPIQGLKNDELFVYEARRLDGSYDELLLAKPHGEKEWKVVFAGSYYDLKKAVQ
ncbi:hypothetical protein [Aedoeadaptatus pacaensis]|uniref:hypothetical protein n=1 Tax=Aedoeadaptatus pacaensis TaxID=1776390 RepID=UPI0008392D1C|nr:hypothetical protein [Peptoniphilus pacaensis]